MIITSNLVQVDIFVYFPCFRTGRLQRFPFCTGLDRHSLVHKSSTTEPLGLRVERPAGCRLPHQCGSSHGTRPNPRDEWNNMSIHEPHESQTVGCTRLPWPPRPVKWHQDRDLNCRLFTPNISIIISMIWNTPIIHRHFANPYLRTSCRPCIKNSHRLLNLGGTPMNPTFVPKSSLSTTLTKAMIGPRLLPQSMASSWTVYVEKHLRKAWKMKRRAGES